MCRWVGVSRSGYYAWRSRVPSERELSDRALLRRITQIYDRSEGRYGSPRVYETLRQQGYSVARKRVARLMHEAGLKGRVTQVTRRMPGLKRFLTKGQNKILNHGETTACDQIWVADVTYLKVKGRWCYLATVMDRHSRRILGWLFDYTRTTDLSVAALRQALRKNRNPSGVILHTDRGVEFTGSKFQSELAKAGIEHSVTRPGHCTDNAFMESFYHTLKGELIRQTAFNKYQDLHCALGRYINQFYNSVRLHSGLGYSSPMEYERMAA